MHNYRNSGEFDRLHHQQNSPIVEEYSDFAAYNIWVPAQAMVDVAGAYVTTAYNAHVGLVLPDAVTTTLGYGMRKPRTWVSGFVSAKVWYTGDKIAGTNAVMTLGVITTVLNSAITAATASANNSVPSPNPAYAMSVYQGFTLTKDGGNILVKEKDNYINFELSRIGGHASDTYTGDLILLGLEIIYEEAPHKTPMLKNNFVKRNQAFNNN